MLIEFLSIVAKTEVVIFRRGKKATRLGSEFKTMWKNLNHPITQDI